MDVRELVGWNLRRLRVAKGVSQEALGHAVPCEASYVGRIERGGENVTVLTLENLARALEADVIEFFRTPAPSGDPLPTLKPGRKSSKALKR